MADDSQYAQWPLDSPTAQQELTTQNPVWASKFGFLPVLSGNETNVAKGDSLRLNANNIGTNRAPMDDSWRASTERTANRNGADGLDPETARSSLSIDNAARALRRQR